MPLLDPSKAAKLASAIYDVSDKLSRQAFFAAFEDTLSPDNVERSTNPFQASSFATKRVRKSSSFRGRTGALFLKKQYMMGLVAYGAGAYERDVFVIIQGASSLFDGLTDLNAGVKVSSTGPYVPQGFEDSFRSFKTDIERFFNEHQGGVQRVH